MRLLARIGLARPEHRAWAMYDWANSAFVTTIITAVYPIYFIEVAGGTLQAQSTTTAVSLAIVAVLAPLLGALADYAPVKKKLLLAFLCVGLAATFGMFWIRQGDWLLACALFGVANIGVSGSFVFYDALLPHIATEEEVDRVSTAGYALGYVGGGLLLIVNLTMIMKPAWFGIPDGGLAFRLSFVSVGVWWAVFAIPLFRRVPEPPVLLTDRRLRGKSLVRTAASGLARTLRELKVYRQALRLLVAFLIYNDGVGTIIRMATAYGKEIGLDGTPMIIAIIIVQFVGIPFAFLFGQIAGKIGTKRAVLVGLGVYCVVSVLGYFMKTALHFYLLAGLVGMVQGGVQALSRSLFASMIPRAKSSEFFGLFAVFEKFAGIFGPAMFSLLIWASGSHRAAVLSIIGFFVVGGVLLLRVNVAEGQRLARAANEAASG